LGLKDNLVGRSHECDFPSTIKKVPVCADIDHAAPLKPDVILSQKNLPGPKNVALNPRTLDDVWLDIQRVADVLGVSAEGAKKVQLYKSKVEAITRKSAALNERPRVAMIDGINPLQAPGRWVPELVERAGGINLFGKSGQPSERIRYEDLRKSDPDVIAFLPSHLTIDRMRDELEAFTTHEGWFDLKAVVVNQVFLLDGHHYFSRPGPRLVESLEILAEIIHPDEFDFGHKNDGWQYWGFNRF
jgi:iron complex transport system substrate-binding protein